MAGRGEKGLLITTGTFTNDARAESKRDSAPPIDLIDGGRLCDLPEEVLDRRDDDTSRGRGRPDRN
jgi:restriction system protein